MNEVRPLLFPFGSLAFESSSAFSSGSMTVSKSLARFDLLWPLIVVAVANATFVVLGVLLTASST